MNELQQIEVIVLPIEIVKAARTPFRKVSASISKNEQAAIRSEVNFHVAEIIQWNIQRTVA